MEEKAEERRKLPFDKVLTNMLSKILLDTNVRKEDILVVTNGDEIKLAQITQKQLYEESLSFINTDHHS